MKSSTPFVALFLAVFAAGCAQAAVPATLSHVGPATGAAPTTSGQGNLIVFSAYETGPTSPTEIDAEARHHSDYQIRRNDGQLVTSVKNRTTAFGDTPAAVNLAPGDYQLLVRSNGSGFIALPLTVTPDHTTTIHLEGTINPPSPVAATGYDAVRLSNGKIVGWSVTQ